jgi:cellulose synthase operon protein C
VATPPAVEGQQASGVAFTARYDSPRLSGDVGTTPLGFKHQTVLAGVEWRPRLGPNTELQLGVERRAVTDSVLSYNGATDPLSGRRWGAVVRTGARIGLSYDDGDSGLYASVAYDGFKGESIENNNALQVNAGGYIRPYRENDAELQVGFNANFARFEHNLRYFTLGQGGYFSPQQFVAFSIPITYKDVEGHWSYKIEAAPGLQYFHENGSPYFPTDPSLQGALISRAALDPTVAAFYPGQTKTGFGFRGGAQVEYEFMPQTRIAATLKFDNFGDYNETTAMLSLKRILGQRE